MPDQTWQNCFLDAPDIAKIQQAARDIILAVKRDKGLTEGDLARLLDVDRDTVRRLENLETKKVPASLISTIGAVYGGSYIEPYMRLFGHKAVPASCEEAVNILPALTALAAKVAAAAKDGRVGLNHQALAGMMLELCEVDGIVTKLRARASGMGIAA
jgi:hypothetical protein